MSWDEVSEMARTYMKLIGNFSPTSNPEHKMLKGYLSCDEGEDGRTYFNSGELRELAAACTEAADWLDKRAESGKP